MWLKHRSNRTQISKLGKSYVTSNNHIISVKIKQKGKQSCHFCEPPPRLGVGEWGRWRSDTKQTPHTRKKTEPERTQPSFQLHSHAWTRLGMLPKTITHDVAKRHRFTLNSKYQCTNPAPRSLNAKIRSAWTRWETRKTNINLARTLSPSLLTNTTAAA